MSETIVLFEWVLSLIPVLNRGGYCFFICEVGTLDYMSICHLHREYTTFYENITQELPLLAVGTDKTPTK